MKTINNILLIVALFLFSCISQEKKDEKETQKNLSAKEILGNPDYLAISYGGYRTNSRDVQPTIAELQEDMKILHAMGIRIVRTYNVHFSQAANLLEAIHQLKKEDASFEMYVMLGAWIDCKNAFNWSQGEPNHNEESDRNSIEIATTISLAKQYPDIVKIIAVGNEAMVKWATSYYVQPNVILKWVNHLQELKKSGELSKDLWITSSDNFASWGGGDDSYHTEDLDKLINAVDYISMHTYPMHDTHYNPVFWGTIENEQELSKIEQIDAAMLRSKEYAISQYKSVKDYIKSLRVNKPIHIGETGWASFSGGHYGITGSKATDEYKEALFYKHMREWTKEEGISCFYFEAFDENWKDAQNPNGSENHFGLFTIEGKAKYVLWNLVDKEVFKGLTRSGKLITKTYNGDKRMLLKDVLIPSVNKIIVNAN
ncbi:MULTISPECIES: glycosyl hydrolase family 17 protein [Tenacibaculum]|uniref:glycosyl hydrolase family 17 protein n=1 Tax=Tenacibaculum TaxID=104267 RepID=UPI001F0A0778|nr:MULTISPECIES: glycosyl hydrolase family 17 protein [Tenacibaculum]MCH3882015.1 glycosyl hydrolase family 17 protein [Tenacibaculum aquimarinum]MDO6601066.1 glycosyl hydrolase family 17 protein [Tenacibaculum sp. 1_MG-2023]